MTTTTLNTIFKTIFNPIPSSTLRHYHVRCSDAEGQNDFIEKLTVESKNQETGFIVNPGSCLFIDKSPKDLFFVIIEAYYSLEEPSTFKNKEDFLKYFHGVIYEDNENLSQQLILCLRHSEVLQDIEESTIVADLFRGFGDEMFKKYVQVVTLSTIPWSMMFSNSTAVSPLCISMEYSDRNCVAAVTRLQERMIAKNGKRFCKEFIKQCCKTFEKNTTDTTKLYSLICHIGRMCDGITDPEIEGYNRDIVKQMIRNLDPELHYFNVSRLLSTKTTTTPFKDVKKEEAMESIPHYAKFILIAAFCCSFNRQSTDMRFFNMEREGRKRTAVKNIEPNKFHEIGPQPFTLTRLMGVVSFIFNSNLKENERIPSDIERMINRLCDMRILTRISTSNNISNVKFRCDASSDFVRDIATSIGIEISEYLDGDVHDLVNKLQLIKLK